MKAGGCRHLWSLSVTLDDFDGSFFLNAPRKAEKNGAGSVAAPGRPGRSSGTASAPPAPSSRQAPAHPMNALALARAFHPRAPGGGAGALMDGDNGAVGGGGGHGPKNRVSAGSGRGSITSLGLPYARLHLRTVEGLATYAVSSLTHLDLSFCHVGAAGAAALAHALDGSGGGGGGTSHSNSNINNTGNGSGRRSSSSSVARGRGSHSLRSLKLPHNFVGDSGARALGRSLSNNRCLTFLSLASNGIGLAGGRALATALASRGAPPTDGGGTGGCGGGGGGSALARLDLGDNPLGEKATKLLVDAASAVGGGGGGGDAKAPVQILGLDRVAGASVATREAARRHAVGRNGACLPGTDGAKEPASGAALVAIDQEVSVRHEDANGDDGFVQVRAIFL